MPACSAILAMVTALREFKSQPVRIFKVTGISTALTVAVKIFSTKASLRINAELADLLNQLVNQLPMTLDVPNIQRVAILLEKMYPGSGGQTLAQIFYNFYLYRQAYQQSVADFSGEPNLNEVLFRHEAELQKQYLGEVLVRQLFAEQNLLANYLFGRKLINQNKVLSRLEKQQKLSELKDEFVRQKR